MVTGPELCVLDTTILRYYAGSWDLNSGVLEPVPQLLTMKELRLSVQTFGFLFSLPHV